MRATSTIALVPQVSRLPSPARALRSPLQISEPNQGSRQHFLLAFPQPSGFGKCVINLAISLLCCIKFQAGRRKEEATHPMGCHTGAGRMRSARAPSSPGPLPGHSAAGRAPFLGGAVSGC